MGEQAQDIAAHIIIGVFLGLFILGPLFMFLGVLIVASWKAGQTAAATNEENPSMIDRMIFLTERIRDYFEANPILIIGILILLSIFLVQNRKDFTLYRKVFSL